VPILSPFIFIYNISFIISGFYENEIVIIQTFPQEMPESFHISGIPAFIPDSFIFLCIYFIAHGHNP